MQDRILLGTAAGIAAATVPVFVVGVSFLALRDLLAAITAVAAAVVAAGGFREG